MNHKDKQKFEKLEARVGQLEQDFKTMVEEIRTIMQNYDENFMLLGGAISQLANETITPKEESRIILPR